MTKFKGQSASKTTLPHTKSDPSNGNETHLNPCGQTLSMQGIRGIACHEK
ncbi:hypothetical protein HanPSC8_Chr05g0195981 [Helianthus annuus]|nr:hypothetical protein HanPSC8_Chr05g0195981 [Helianthus annuus]